jgi:hypothetical protein
MPRDAAEEIDMTRGQNTNSGPPPDPNSLKSAKRGLVFTALPAGGYAGDVPEFPLKNRQERELELWEWAWTTPQACAWAREPWRWLSVAMWVRTQMVCESLEATAADKNSLHRFADQIGLTPAGLAFNGWRIAADQLSEKRAEKAPAPSAPTARDRMKALRGAAGQ